MNLLLTHNGSSSLHYVVVIVVPTDIAYHINLRIAIKKDIFNVRRKWQVKVLLHSKFVLIDCKLLIVSS